MEQRKIQCKSGLTLFIPLYQVKKNELFYERNGISQDMSIRTRIVYHNRLNEVFVSEFLVDYPDCYTPEGGHATVKMLWWQQRWG